MSADYGHLCNRILAALPGELLPDTSWNIPERVEQRLAMVVCEKTDMTPELWHTLSKEGRIPWLDTTLKAIEAQPAPNAWREGDDLPVYSPEVEAERKREELPNLLLSIEAVKRRIYGDNYAGPDGFAPPWDLLPHWLQEVIEACKGFGEDRVALRNFREKLLASLRTMGANWTWTQELADAWGPADAELNALRDRLFQEQRNREQGSTVAVGTEGQQAQAAKGEAGRREQSPQFEAQHSDDFTSVTWGGTPYTFSKGLQAESIRVLWEHWDKGTPTISEQAIGERIGSASNRFRLYHVFNPKGATGSRQKHPAWKTLIQKAGRGLYRLAER